MAVAAAEGEGTALAEGASGAERRGWYPLVRDILTIAATLEGLPAIELLISQDMNVNVTLLFSQAMYEKVAERYIAGLERRAAEGGTLGRISSVASFFISRIDSAVDPLVPEALRGKTADDIIAEAARIQQESESAGQPKS